MRRLGLFVGLVGLRAVPASPQAAGPAAADSARHWEVVLTAIPAARAAGTRALGGGMLRGSCGDGGSIVLLSPSGSRRVLTPQFESAADPSVSFDGKRVLFAGKRSASDPWDIYEMNADGSGVRRITRNLGNCRSPIYQSPIFYLDDPGPMPQVAFVSDMPGTVGEYGEAPATAVYSARLDGSGVRRLTYNPSGAFDPAMLPDGRMLFSGWERAGLRPGFRGRIDLLAVNIDGTDYATFSGDQGRRIKHMACVTAKRRVLFVDADASAWDGAGPLGVIDLRRNLRSYRRLVLPGVWLYHSPSALPDGAVLVSRRPAAGGGTHGIVRLEPETGKIEPVFDSPETHDIQAQALVPRTVPDGRSSVVDEKQPWAKLYCLNVYETDLSRRLWPKGLVKRIRLLEGLPLPRASFREEDGLSPPLPKRFLGEFDVDDDGSFHAQIPANVPVQIQALDENGMALRSSSWMWAKNNEQRGCIGCHEDGERTPENVLASALTRPAANLTLPPERRRTVEFERDVAPIVRRRCATAACHNAAPLKLTGADAYRALMVKERYVTRGAARLSPLVWAIFGRCTSRPWDQPPPAASLKKMPPAGSPPLTQAEKRTVVEWIDLGARRGGGLVPAGVGGRP